ncbi:DUF3592 domain-containing protein [Streptosporangium sp. NPDC004379]|uniref:DUF3592 domain-containing protein n=1 Tax=Streptosporangium sp. NPDC004379 TaxID=3366189 RepID=UPI003689AE88
MQSDLPLRRARRPRGRGHLEVRRSQPPRPGDRVMILYDPQKPRHARIDTGGQRGSTMGWILTGLGLLATLGVLTAVDIV